MRKYFLSVSMIIVAAFASAQGQKGPSASFVFPEEQKSTPASLTIINNQPACCYGYSAIRPINYSKRDGGI